MRTTGQGRDSLLGPTVVIRGELTAREEQLTIMGTVEGTINHDQTLTIHRDGKVSAEIRAQEVIVNGTVDGDIHGTKRVRIAQTGRVNGDVYTQLFSVDEGAVIKGNVIMDADAEPIEQRFESPTETVREALPAQRADTKKQADVSVGGKDDA